MKKGLLLALVVLCSAIVEGQAPLNPQIKVPVEINPGESIQAAIAANESNTVFHLRPGTHRMQPLLPKAGDVFLGDGKATILSGAKVLTGWTFDGTRWWVGGQTQQGDVPTSAAEACRPAYQRCAYPEDLFFDGSVMKFHETSLSAVGPGEWFFDYVADRIYVGDDPNGHLVETSVTPQVFIASGASGVIIKNMVVEKYATPTGSGAVNLGASFLGGGGWTAEGLEVRYNHGGGISVDATTIAKGNYVHHNCGFGFVGAGWDIVVEGNEIAYNNVRPGVGGTCGYDSFWGAGGSKWVWTTRLTVRENFSHHNDGPGFWTDINNIYTLYENNTVEDNVRGGIFHEISYDATIRSNTARRNGTGHDFPWWTTGAGIEVVSSRNVEVANNLVVDNWQGITGLEDRRGVGNDGPWTLINFNVHDNTVVNNSALPGGGGRTGVEGDAATFTTANNRFTGNRYFLGTGAVYFFWNSMNLDLNGWRGVGQN